MTTRPEILRYKLRDGECDTNCECCGRAIRRIVEINGKIHGERCAKKKISAMRIERAPWAMEIRVGGPADPSGDFARLDGEIVRVEWVRAPGPLLINECYAVGAERRYLGAQVWCRFHWAA